MKGLASEARDFKTQVSVAKVSKILSAKMASNAVLRLIGSSQRT